MKKLEEFIVEFKQDVIDRSNSDDIFSTKEEAFTAIMAEELSAAGSLESPEVCFFEHGSSSSLKKANGYSVPEDDTQLDIFVSLYHGTSQPETVNTKDVERCFNQAARFFDSATKSLHEKVEPGSAGFSMLHHIHGLKDDIDRVRFILFTDGRLAQRSKKKLREKVSNYIITHEIWDIERIHRFRSSGASHEPVEVDLSELPDGGIPCISVESSEIGYQTNSAVFPGTLLYDLYDEYGQRLLELNVRSYLQARGKVNKGILETLIEQPERFLAYNNGITVVAEQLELGPISSGGVGIKRIKGMQIVNGGQTTASIHRAGKGEKTGKYRGLRAELEKVFVHAKVTVIDADKFDEMVPLISRFSNTQNKVTEVDLRANHAFHIGIERRSLSTWTPGESSKWFYERARGSYQTLKARRSGTPKQKADFEKEFPTSQRISMQDLAKFENCWHEQPHVASRGGQKSFVHFMQRIGDKEEGWEPTVEDYKHFMARAILYKSAYKICRQLGMPGLQVHCCNYTVSALAYKTAKRIDLDQIWNQHRISAEMEATITRWAPVIMDRMIESAGARNQTEWFKKEDCWMAIRDSALEISESLQSELKGAPVAQPRPAKKGAKKKAKKPLTNEDQNNIARCMEADSEKWHQIAKWGQESGSLEDLECGISSTLSQYALGGWKRVPSAKQAMRGVEILKKAEGQLSAIS
jgi:hypothetical protein